MCVNLDTLQEPGSRLVSAAIYVIWLGSTYKSDKQPSSLE